MNKFGGENGRGGGKRPWNNNQGSKLSFDLDCYCIYCGGKMVNQAIAKHLVCPNVNCKMPVPGRTAPSMRAGGLIHCWMCDRWTNPTHFHCMNCGAAGRDAKEGFVAARRRLMSKNPDAVAEGKSISLAELGGLEYFGTPPKKANTKLVLVYPKPIDPFNAEGDRVLGEIPDVVVNTEKDKGDTNTKKKKDGGDETLGDEGAANEEPGQL